MSVEVKQSDREAAGAWCLLQPFPSKQVEGPKIIAGEWDQHTLVQAFAAHRRQAEEAMRERCAAICDYHVGAFADAENAGNDEAEEAWHGGMAHAANRLAAAIRSMEVE